MRNGPSTFFLDTNVIVYAYDTVDAAKRARAMAVLEQLGGSQRGALSAQVLVEFFVTVTQKIPQPLSLEEAERSIAGLDPALLPPALRTAHELVVGGIEMRRLRTKAARAASLSYGRPCIMSSVPRLA